MNLSRMELDMIGSPTGLVTKIYKLEPSIPIQVPIEQIAYALDIESIQELDAEGYEGGLITTPERTTGVILVKKINVMSPVAIRRRKFTIAHELGHFLIPSHQPSNEKFLCDSEAMRSWDTRAQNNYKRQEAEANEFAALLLMPPPRMRDFLKRKRNPSINDIIDISEHFDVSLSAAARNYVETHDETLAIVFVKGTKVLWSYRNKDFPWITAHNGCEVPRTSNYYYPTADIGMQKCISETWIDIPRTQLFEQVHRQANGYAMILLQAEKPDDEDQYDEEAEMTSAQRYRYRNDWTR